MVGEKREKTDMLISILFIFSRYDVRDKAPTDAKRWSLEDRLFFQVMYEPAHLSIQNLELKDEGVYRCRVDFKNSPTRNIRVNLTIVGKLF